MNTHLTEVHPPTNPCTYFPGSAHAQRLCEKDVGKDEGSLGVPTTAENILTFRSQYGRKTSPYCTRGCGVPASQLRGQLVPMTLPNSVFQDSPIQVRPIVVMQELRRLPATTGAHIQGKI